MEFYLMETHTIKSNTFLLLMIFGKCVWVEEPKYLKVILPFYKMRQAWSARLVVMIGSWFMICFRPCLVGEQKKGIISLITYQSG